MIPNENAIEDEEQKESKVSKSIAWCLIFSEIDYKEKDRQQK